MRLQVIDHGHRPRSGSKPFNRNQSVWPVLPKTESWEVLGGLLISAAALFDLVYAAPGVATLIATFGGVRLSAASPAGAVGLAGLAYSALVGFVCVVLGQVRGPDDNVGAALLFWIDFVVLVIGGIAFYALSFSSTVVLLIGGMSGVLTTLGTLVILHRRRA